ncbi:MAG: ABC transporter permease [Gemmatimonadota bacterium]|nr:MAG: ABC transporter permease [Gemmatimonadota bacterium]
MGIRVNRVLRFGGLWVALAALLITGVVAVGALVAGGYDPGVALSALVRGAAGSPEQLFSVTLVRSVPLILTGLAVALAFRAGVWNIGAEGQLYAGAIAGVWVGLAAGDLPGWIVVPLVLLVSSTAGAVWALIPTLMRLRLGVYEVITTILMNFVAIQLVGYMVSGPLQESRGVFPQTDAISASARLPLLIPGTRLHIGFAVALLLGAALWVVLRSTVFGFRLQVVGQSPAAARITGRIDGARVIFVTFLASGGLAGLAGAMEVSGRTFALYEGLSPGWGYTAIAVALLAGLHPMGVVGVGILFGALEGGAGAMQREAGIPEAWVSGIEALVILAVLAADQGRKWFARTRSERARPAESSVG